MDATSLHSVNDVLTQITDYMPTLLAGTVVLLIGLVIAWVGSKLLVRLLVLSRIDRILARTGWLRALDKGDVRHSLLDFIGTLAGALVFLVFLENAVVIWRLTVLSELLERFVINIPRFIVAVIIMLVGWGLATGVSRSVRRSLYQEEFERARLVGRIVHAAILVIASAIALVQIDIAVPIVTGAFFITFGALALAFVLAFGLGSKGAVEAMWQSRLSRPARPEPDNHPKPQTEQHADDEN